MEVDKRFLDEQDIITELNNPERERNLEDYNIGGVWALFGKKKRKNNNTWFCLQVAQTGNIKKEIIADIKCLESKTDMKRKKKSYVNQFGEEMFFYYEYPSCREQLYNEIMKKYESLVFICVCKGDDIPERKKIEKYFAWNAHALYWRNGGAYTEAKNYQESKLNEMKKEIINEIINNKDLDNVIPKIRDLFFK
ncbi:hypothetical protein [Clostridium saccharoperbutylacetonicum]|uniref:hypothetical protein n=1 Tax=Clostridium saccharoperbutylacetonicum TaxID=36745 RepID=UPI000983AB92|nr:hypothetical protein [Clostridium saccharoperbutylacetonicum]AQR93398.1 hypothetical protein CLSAP_06960 [Clostridium saccharoperbutylacetonicum]NSB29095.1 hypothetical protein [Clostridium saccharoperbutylacetonicum]